MSIPVIFENATQAEAAYRRRAALEQAAQVDPSLMESRWFERQYDQARRDWRSAFKVESRP